MHHSHLLPTFFRGRAAIVRVASAMAVVGRRTGSLPHAAALFPKDLVGALAGLHETAAPAIVQARRAAGVDPVASAPNAAVYRPIYLRCPARASFSSTRALTIRSTSSAGSGCSAVNRMVVPEVR